MKKIIIVLLAAVIIALAAFYFWPKTSVAPTTDGVKIDSTADWQTYTDSDFAFSLQYPQAYAINQGGNNSHNAGEFFQGRGVQVVTISIPKDDYQGTNFFDGFLTIATQQTQATADRCQTMQNDGSTEVIAMPDTKVVNGLTFNRGETSGAAAGTMAKDIVYHGYTNGICYEASLNLFQGNIDNYTEGAVEQVDEAEVFAKLQAVLETLTVTNRLPIKPTPLLYLPQVYPAGDNLTGAAAEVDFTTNLAAKEFSSQITEAVAKGANFAGYYTLASWGCGTNCQSVAIVDDRTGKIIAYGLPSSYGYQFSLDSNLLIINSPTNWQDLPTLPDLTVAYYELVNGKLNLLAEQKPGTDISKEQLSVPSGLRAMVTIGPTCPVVQNPPQDECQDKPYQTQFNINGSDGILVTTAASGADGSLEVKLASGDYTISKADKSSMPSFQAQDFSVVQGLFTDLTITFDSGIR